MVRQHTCPIRCLNFYNVMIFEIIIFIAINVIFIKFCIIRVIGIGKNNQKLTITYRK